MEFKMLSKLIGEKAAIGLVGFLFGDEGKIDLAEAMDSEKLLQAVNSEANADMRLKKATVLMGTLNATRANLVKIAAKAAQTEGATSANVQAYAVQIAGLDAQIKELQKTLDQMTVGREAAKTWVNNTQARVQINLVKDQITLTKKELNELLEQQVEFTQDMITALPGSGSDKLRESVEKKVDDENAFNTSKLDVLNRLAQQQVSATNPVVLDEAAAGTMDEILKAAGLTPSEEK